MLFILTFFTVILLIFDNYILIQLLLLLYYLFSGIIKTIFLVIHIYTAMLF